MEPGEVGTYARLKEKGAKSYAIPGTLRTRVAAETMRGWLHYASGARAVCLEMGHPTRSRFAAVKAHIQ